MANWPTRMWVLALCFVFLFICLSFLPSTAAGPDTFSSIRAVNLGGWLVTEGWIKPSLFDGIVNNDILDGTQVQFKSMTIGKYLCAENGGDNVIVANRPFASGWETFKLWRVDPTHFQFRVFGNQFIGLEAGAGAGAVAVAKSPGNSETFEIVRSPSNRDRVRIRASNGLFLQAKTETSVTADFGDGGSWGDDDPSVFEMTKVYKLMGEYQVTNGYGPLLAPDVMKSPVPAPEKEARLLCQVSSLQKTPARSDMGRDYPGPDPFF